MLKNVCRDGEISTIYHWDMAKKLRDFGDLDYFQGHRRSQNVRNDLFAPYLLIFHIYSAIRRVIPF